MVKSVTVTKDRILCRIHEGERKLASGIIIPELEYDFNKKSDVGTRALVIAVGPWQREVKPNDEVIVEKLGGIEIKIEGEEYVIFDSHEVLAVLIGLDEWSDAGKPIYSDELIDRLVSKAKLPEGW